MRRQVIAAVCLLAAAAATQGRGQQQWNRPPSQPVPGVEHGTYRSPSMDVEVGYNVLLPDGHADSETRYPVVYWLHGLGGNENSGTRLMERIRALTNDNGIRPMLFVFANGGASTMYADSADGETKAATTILDELIPHIDAKYRTIAERRGRALEGFSMGGYGALMLGAMHPELFCAVLSYAGALHDQETLSTSRASIYQEMFGSPEAFDAFSPYRWVRENAEGIRESLALRMVVGTRDPTLEYNETMRAVLQELDIPHEYEVVEGMGHDIAGYYDAVGLQGLRFLEQHLGAGAGR